MVLECKQQITNPGSRHPRTNPGLMSNKFLEREFVSQMPASEFDKKFES
jgi:hypothetical protein